MFAGNEVEQDYNQTSFTFSNFFLSSYSCRLKQQNVKGIRFKKKNCDMNVFAKKFSEVLICIEKKN